MKAFWAKPLFLLHHFGRIVTCICMTSRRQIWIQNVYIPPKFPNGELNKAFPKGTFLRRRADLRPYVMGPFLNPFTGSLLKRFVKYK